MNIRSTAQVTKGQVSELPTSYEDSLNENAMSGASAAGASEEEGAGQASNPVMNDVSGKDSSNDASKYKVVIGHLSSPVRAGLSLDASVATDKIKIPQNVLDKDNTVYVLNKENKIEKRKIKVEKKEGSIYVKSGLKEGERLVQNSKSSLKEGDKIEVKE